MSFCDDIRRVRFHMILLCQVLDWKYFLGKTIKQIDGISIPRAYKLSKKDGHIILYFREQMGDIGHDGKAITWKPLSGPIRILNDEKLDRSRRRLIPKKPVPIEGLRVVVRTLTKYNKLDDVHIKVYNCIFKTCNVLNDM